MSSAKKGKKNKGTVFSLVEFMGTSATANGNSAVVFVPKVPSWAEEVDEFEERHERIVLPTGPRSSRGPDIDPDCIPKAPPYTAYIANLPFDVEDPEIENFFSGLKINHIRLPKEGGDGGRFKGFGYVEFQSRQDLVEALTKNDDLMRNRKIRVDIAEGDGMSRRSQNSKFEDKQDRSEGVSDWRATPRSSDRLRGDDYEHRNDSSMRDNRSPGRGYDSRYRDRRYGGGGGGGDRGYNDYGDRSYNRDRYDDRDRGGRYSGKYDDNRRSGGYRRDGDDRKYHSNRDDYDKDQAKERPKLNLKPRTVSQDKQSDSPAAQSSIFGSARPVNTAARELEIEKKLLQKEPKPTTAVKKESSSVQIFGAAKPVDTAAREREIEEKLMKQETNAPRREEKKEDLQEEVRDPKRYSDIREYKQHSPERELSSRKKPVEYDETDTPPEDVTEKENKPAIRKPKKGKQSKEPDVILDTTNKFASLGLEEEEA